MPRKYKKICIEYEMPIKCEINTIPNILFGTENNEKLNTLIKVLKNVNLNFNIALPKCWIKDVKNIDITYPIYIRYLFSRNEYINLNELKSLFDDIEFKKIKKYINIIGNVGDYIYSTNRCIINYDEHNNNKMINKIGHVEYKDSLIKENNTSYYIFKQKIKEIEINLENNSIFYYTDDNSIQKSIFFPNKKISSESDLKFEQYYSNNYIEDNIIKRKTYGYNHKYMCLYKILSENIKNNYKGNNTFNYEKEINKGIPYDIRCTYSNKIEDIINVLRLYYIKTELVL